MSGRRRAPTDGAASRGGTRVALRHRLLVRLLAGALLIALGSTAATAWLVSRTTATALRDADARSLATDAQIYNALVGYAATHRDWHGVGPLTARLDRTTGRRIVLTDRGRRPLAGESPSTPLPAVASAAIDPLHVERDLAGGSSTIDPRALAPFRPKAVARARAAVAAPALCLDPADQAPAQQDDLLPAAPVGQVPADAASEPATAEPAPATKTAPCRTDPLERPTTAERRALRQLDRDANACLDRRRLPSVAIGLDLAPDLSSAAARACVDAARRRQLAPHVAPAALLFLSLPAGQTRVLDLSGENRWRVALLAAAVLALTAAVTFVLAARLTRPLRRLTDAVDGARDAPIVAPVTTRDEIGRLTTAFNDLTARRRQLDGQRKAMVRDIAHELRGPVTNMRSWLEAADDGLVATDADLRATLLDEALQLQHIIADLADLAAADAGELVLHREPLAAAEVVRQAVDAHRAAAQAAGVTLTTRIDDDAALAADPVRLRQILGNLLSNAIRHARDEVRVSAGRDGSAVTIAVADDGDGIAAEDLPRLFDRFWRADPSRSRRTGGSGLGLSIARQLAQAHGGTLSAASDGPGAGARFVLLLPATPPGAR
ncbi:HAMP domain-containing sensor histidine kinase [Conexibacter sp. JD483]|uniref:sensor histidine kinase n=1 Tax=unclassified Conexibacter TaxID=2627773 RepID=UPI00271FDC84|nr:MULTISPECIES: HAMP domain-containing sensor histidine kinase [unclassified Conexibacter]MDO8189404.1 HAMP domain-containing sensor histidine kinase [Conexibacter sp. CPCC 205706]MDO8202013.1 HAMP domain-containing sensor histidine kinase [Conexibacter sp. CPCC 205762]MDR9372476.1 HAMP domain-containing sensor histidine kinase [Conexibacter sp. JD483]